MDLKIEVNREIDWYVVVCAIMEQLISRLPYVCATAASEPVSPDYCRSYTRNGTDSTRTVASTMRAEQQIVCLATR